MFCNVATKFDLKPLLFGSTRLTGGNETSHGHTLQRIDGHAALLLSVRMAVTKILSGKAVDGCGSVMTSNKRNMMDQHIVRHTH